MDPLVALLVGLVLGLLLASVAVAVRSPRARQRREERAPGTAEDRSELRADEEGALSRRLVDLMDPAVIVLGADDAVLMANPSARALGILRGNRVLVPGLVEVARNVQLTGSRRADVALPGDLVGTGPRMVGVHGIRLGTGPVVQPGPVALVLQDVTEARRVEAVRRDFVANVGHELKTPVGALALLAEAVQGAADDPETVQRFAARMQHEAARLARLVRELIDLSRLQGAEPLPELVPVAVGTVVAEAVDRTRAAAAAKDIQLAVAAQPGLVVRGAEAQLATALTNLLANAVAYSPPDTTIAVGARARSGFAEIAVTDSGIGIPRSDRSRVFERFYRVDQSRASATGGTGLGLAIVKHVASNHGGSVTVWSEEGLGSTFTLRIPLDADAEEPHDQAAPERPPVPPLHPSRGFDATGADVPGDTDHGPAGAARRGRQ
ncbi:two-component sensor histidine kinase [Modestobacter muralis]|uniref:Sensor-like histidine kinase SenX3 n=1 Tax=Modestobacter muralis TaxID=1608614 RepID=A0A6P0H767_9ACTN|nr:two-component sensor histidine kinase [Modestobacter muralis]NEN50044.1 two-component sensor histidine kinase [Modestobacter muralis]